jgi:hypothetical protein
LYQYLQLHVYALLHHCHLRRRLMVSVLLVPPVSEPVLLVMNLLLHT